MPTAGPIPPSCWVYDFAAQNLRAPQDLQDLTSKQYTIYDLMGGTEQGECQ
jgi:hypothetical protein